MMDRHLVGAGAAACAVCCAPLLLPLVGLVGTAATLATLAFAGVALALVVGLAAAVAAWRIRRRSGVRRPSGEAGPVDVELGASPEGHEL